MPPYPLVCRATNLLRSTPPSSSRVAEWPMRNDTSIGLSAHSQSSLGRYGPLRTDSTRQAPGRSTDTLSLQSRNLLCTMQSAHSPGDTLLTLRRPCASICSSQDVRRTGEGEVGWGLPAAVRDTTHPYVCRRDERNSRGIRTPQSSGDSDLRCHHLWWDAELPCRQQLYLAPGISSARTRRGSQPVTRSPRVKPVDRPTRRKAPRPFAIDVLSPSGGPPFTLRFSPHWSPAVPPRTRRAPREEARLGWTIRAMTFPSVLGRRCPDAQASHSCASTRQVAACLESTRGLP